MTASAAQQKKFDTFVKRADRELLLELAVETIIAADLDWDELGIRWGITVCVDRTSVLRLNVGNRVLLDVTTEHGVQLFVVHPSDRSADWVGEVAVYEGFPQVKDSLRLVTDGPDDMIELLLDSEDLANEVRDHAEASGRDLPRDDWHNPLIDELLLEVADAVFDEYDAADTGENSGDDLEVGLPPTTTSTCRERAGIWHPAVITGLSAPGNHDPLQDIAGGAKWWGSDVAPTAVWAGDLVESRGHHVTPIFVETQVPLADHVSDDELLFIASECNRLGGISSVVVVGDHLVFRTAIATFPGIDGWVSVWTGAAVMSSAMSALHLTTDLRRPSPPGPFGLRGRPNPLIADYAGWEVPAEDRHLYVLPTLDDVCEAVDSWSHAGLRHHVQGDGSVLVTTPGVPTLRLSLESRAPWGGGLVCSLRLPTTGSLRQNLELAAHLNSAEWDAVPSLNVWGGWSGTDSTVEVHSFVPHMLFRRDADQARTIVANLLAWCVVRGRHAEETLGA